MDVKASDNLGVKELRGLCDKLFAVRVITPYRLYRIITLTVTLDDKDHKTVFKPV